MSSEYYLECSSYAPWDFVESLPGVTIRGFVKSHQYIERGNRTRTVRSGYVMFTNGESLKRMKAYMKPLTSAPHIWFEKEGI